MAPNGWPAFTGQPALQVDEDSSREVAVFIGGATRTTVQVPPHVGQGDIGVSPLPVPPRRLDHGCDHRARVPVPVFVPVFPHFGEGLTKSVSSSVSS
jgi:hypothetical protein